MTILCRTVSHSRLGRREGRGGEGRGGEKRDSKMTMQYIFLSVGILAWDLLSV